MFGLPEILHKPAEYLHLASGMIVLGGTMFALLLGTKFTNFVSFLQGIKFVIIPPKQLGDKEAIDILVNLSTVSMNKGKKALVTEIEKLKDPFMKFGLELVIEKTGEDFIRSALYNSIQEMQERHNTVIQLFKNSAVIAPVCGMVGTIVGLIQVLKNMGDPSKLGAAMALGLIATFYGGFFSGMIFTPIAQKLKILSEEEACLKRLITEGILFIECNEIPLKVEKFLLTYIKFSHKTKSSGKTKKE